MKTFESFKFICFYKFEKLLISESINLICAIVGITHRKGLKRINNSKRNKNKAWLIIPTTFVDLSYVLRF